MQGKEELLGKTHPATLLSNLCLDVTLHDQGKDDEAELLHLQAVCGTDEVLGPEHLDTTRSVNCLACLLHKLKRHEDASRLYQRVLRSCEAVLGADHTKTIACRVDSNATQEARGLGLAGDHSGGHPQKQCKAA